MPPRNVEAQLFLNLLSGYHTLSKILLHCAIWGLVSCKTGKSKLTCSNCPKFKTPHLSSSSSSLLKPIKPLPTQLSAVHRSCRWTRISLWYLSPFCEKLCRPKRRACQMPFQPFIKQCNWLRAGYHPNPFSETGSDSYNANLFPSTSAMPNMVL